MIRPGITIPLTSEMNTAAVAHTHHRFLPQEGERIFCSSEDEKNTVSKHLTFAGYIYRFRVIVITTKGEFAGPVTDVQASSVPSKMQPPVANYELSTTTSLYLSWVVPENNGGIILGYKLYRNNGNGTAMSGSSDATCGMEKSPAPQNCIVTGLTPGEEYQIQMATVNEVGEGMRSDPMIFIAAKVPGAPSDLTITAGSYSPTPSLTLTWKSGTDEGAQIFDYILAVKEFGNDTYVEYITMGGTKQVAWSLTSAPTKTLTAADFPGGQIPFEIGRQFLVKVQGVNLVGAGAFGAFTQPTKQDFAVTLNNGLVLSPPRKVSGFQRHLDQTGVQNDTNKMQWARLAETAINLGGDHPENITYHIYGDKIDGYANTLLHSQSHADAPEWEHSGAHASYPVKPGEGWFYTIRAGNAGGFLSEAVLPPVKMIAAFVPGLPRDFTAAMTSNSFETRLNWNPPLDDGGNSLVYYRIRSSQGNAWTSYVDAVQLTHLFTGQAVGSTTYYIAAGNNIGYGPELTVAIVVA